MEDILDVYARPYDPRRPVVCDDEKLVTLHADVAPSLPVAPGQPERVDYEYKRVGTANLFVTVEPLAGWRHTEITERRTQVDFAHHLKWLADERYPDAEVIVLVDDNLNIHALSVLYLVYPPAEARRLVQRFEVHHTPKHASWLNMAEIEINLLQRNCLRRRVPDWATLAGRIAALEAERNADKATITWRFRTADARQKMQRVYPLLLPKDELI
jgi:hypothetical protein